MGSGRVGTTSMEPSLLQLELVVPPVEVQE